MQKPKIKICCISSLEEAEMAIDYGASAIGLVGNMPSGPGVISDDLIKSIAKNTAPPIESFLLTSETKAYDIITHYKRVNTNCIQIVDKLIDNDYQSLRIALPAVKIIQVIHVIDEQSIHQAIQIANHVDAILLDSGNPNLSTKELGGTGRTHNWELSKRICEAISTPVFLAGGINQHNVQEAIETVQPFGIDLCSGVRTDGKLDEQKLKAFFKSL